MTRELTVTENYLNIPICAGSPERQLEIFLAEDGTKLFEFMIPVAEAEGDDYPCDFSAQVPMTEWIGKTVRVEGDMTECFAGALSFIGSSRKAETAAEIRSAEGRPAVHFTADTGWANDPNGLIFDNGLYHLYFQYNPFDIKWNNMSWGHAVSRDLLHWEQWDTVMFPDADGEIFSGCALKDVPGTTGFPDGALLFCYTAGGGENQWSKTKQFTQKLAYSTDGGRTLIRESDPCVPVIGPQSRDPKILWHAQSGAFVMVLWLYGHAYGIFRSTDLRSWDMTQEITFEGQWECPDLYELSDPDGKKQWFFWTPNTEYCAGSFDGRHFEPSGPMRRACLSKLPYAAQTWFGLEDRTVAVSWLRLPNDGRMFTGAYGIPVELSWRETKDGPMLVQIPVRELFEQSEPAHSSAGGDGWGSCSLPEAGGARLIRVYQRSENAVVSLRINGSTFEYAASDGRLVVDGEVVHARRGVGEILLLVDDRILEVFLDGGLQTGAWVLADTRFSFEISDPAAADCEIRVVR